MPCNYLRIRHGDTFFESKAVYDFVLPAALTLMTAAFTTWIGAPLTLFGKQTLFQALSGLLAILIGFYMAALAAVATFHRDGIDEKMKGGDATLKIAAAVGGEKKPKPLTYRQFISYLFGYASFLSFIIYAFLLIMGSVWPRLVSMSKPSGRWNFVVEQIVGPATYLLVYFAVWQLFVTSLLGIYFLAERIQSLNDPDR